MLEGARDLGANRFSSFWRVTLPLSRPTIVASVLLTCLPMLGDYFTSDLLSGSPQTSMVGNLINDSVQTPGQTGQAGAFVLLVLIVVAAADALLRPLGVPRTTGPWHESPGMHRAWWRDPWRKPRLLAAVTIGYLVWSLLPVLIAVAFSFNDGTLAHELAGLLVPLVLGRPRRARSGTTTALHTALLQTLKLGVLATLITVPLGVAVRDRPRPLARPAARHGANSLMLLSFVLPEMLLAVALLFVVTNLALPFDARHHRAGDRPGHLPGVLPGGPRARPAGHHRPPIRGGRNGSRRVAVVGALRRVILPMLVPAIFASTVLVFADVIDDFVLVRYLSGDSSTEPVVGEDLQHRARRPDARAQRPGHAAAAWPRWPPSSSASWCTAG